MTDVHTHTKKMYKDKKTIFKLKLLIPGIQRKRARQMFQINKRKKKRLPQRNIKTLKNNKKEPINTQKYV